MAGLIALAGPPAAHAQDAPVDTAPALSIREALKGESEAVTGTAAGGFDGGDTLDITLTLENHTAAPLVVAVPRGSLFETDDDAEQTAVAVGPADEDASLVKAAVDPTVTLQPGENTVELTGFCAQHLDSGPNEVVPMTWAGVAAEPLTTVLTNIAATEPDDLSAQHAVWWVTDVPVLPVPSDVEPLLEGVDAEAFAANPKRVVADEQYTPAWGRDQALDSDDPFGETPFDFTDPSGSDDPFGSDSGDSGGGGGLSFGLLLVLLVLGCAGVSVLVARSSSRKTPVVAQAARTGGSASPGWYPDPQRAGQVRYWNGSHWTNESRPG